MPPPASAALPLNVTSAGTPYKATASPASTKRAAIPATSTSKHTVNTSDISSPHELTAFVETLLEQLDAKFDDMSTQILDRMEQMSTRVDALEASIQDIINGDTNGPTPSLQQSPILRKIGA
ncbi:heat shock factor binding protein 1-domain-containing protein [Cytidiella melzeri]|nr:heat shock factor binding protein 1-domain-containing protein [Cytidiella melzeri]